MKNKLTALIVMVFIIASFVYPAYAADDGVKDNPAGDDTTYLQYVGILNTLGIETPEEISSPVTRGDFAVNLCKLMNGEKIRLSNQTFSDVSYDTPEVLYAVEFAAALGAIDAGGKFYPDEYITGDQALKMVVVALGYGNEAKVRGGWPYGYVYMANECSLTDGMTDDSTFDGYDMFMLLGNAANTYVNSISTVSSGQDGYITEKYEISAPLLEVYHDIIHVDGIINASDGGYLYSSESIDSDIIMIDDYVFKKAEGISCPLGYYANVYAQKTGSGNYKIIYCDISNNNVTTVNSREILKISEKEINYINEAGNSKKLNFSSEMVVVYNGRAHTTYNADKFALTEGYVSCVSNDGDGTVDVLEIWEPEFLEVRYADVYNDDYELILYDKNNLNHVYITDETTIYCKNDLTDIVPGNILEVYKSKSGERIKINVLADTKSGTVTGIGAEGEIYVGDESFETTDYFDEYYKSNVMMGSNISLVLSTYGKAVATVKQPEGTLTLAYLDGIRQGKGIAHEVELKLFTASGEVALCELAAKIKLDDASVSSEQAYNDLQEYVGNLILYDASADGKITKIICESAESGIYNPSFDGNDSLKRYKFPGSDTETKIYYKSFGYFVPYFCISSATKIFVVAQGESDDAKRFSMGSLSFLGNDAKVESKTIIPYNVTEDGHASILLYVTTSAKATPLVETSSSALIADCTVALDPDGEQAYKVTLYASNKFTQYYVSMEEDFIKSMNLPNGVMPFNTGDYIRYSTDANKVYIRNATVDFSKKTETLNVVEKDNSELHYYYGKLYSVGDSSFGVMLDSGEVIYLPGTAADIGVVEDGDVNTYPIKRMPTYTQVGDECAKILVKCRYSQVGTRIVYN